MMCVLDGSRCDYTRVTCDDVRHVWVVALMISVGVFNSLLILDFLVVTVSSCTELSRWILIVLNGHKIALYHLLLLCSLC